MSSAPSGWDPEVRALEEFTSEVCLALGAPQIVAEEVARHLVGANRAGHDSHGVIRLPMYIEQADRGELMPEAMPVVANEFGAVALCDANRGFGHYTTRFAAEQAARLAGGLRHWLCRSSPLGPYRSAWPLLGATGR